MKPLWDSWEEPHRKYHKHEGQHPMHPREDGLELINELVFQKLIRTDRVRTRPLASTLARHNSSGGALGVVRRT